MLCDDCPSCVTCPSIKTSLILNSYKDVTPRTKEVLKKMDPLTLLALQALPPELVKKNLNPSTNVDVKTEEIDLGWKKNGPSFDAWRRERDVRLVKKVVSSKFTTYKLDADDFYGK
jgi:hypothetical protein